MKAEEKKSEETKKKGDLEIRYMVTDPGYQGAVMRISSVLVIFRKDNQTEELILEDGDGISVNGVRLIQPVLLGWHYEYRY